MALARLRSATLQPFRRRDSRQHRCMRLSDERAVVRPWFKTFRRLACGVRGGDQVDHSLGSVRGWRGISDHRAYWSTSASSRREAESPRARASTRSRSRAAGSSVRFRRGRTRFGCTPASVRTLSCARQRASISYSKSPGGNGERLRAVSWGVDLLIRSCIVFGAAGDMSARRSKHG